MLEEVDRGRRFKMALKEFATSDGYKISLRATTSSTQRDSSQVGIGISAPVQQADTRQAEAMSERSGCDPFLC